MEKYVKFEIKNTKNMLQCANARIYLYKQK